MRRIEPEQTVEELKRLQQRIRDEVVRARGRALHDVHRTSSSDTIYALDAAIDPVIEDFCRELSRTVPLVLIAEGLEDRSGRGDKVFPEGADDSEALIRIIIDPIDGTRGLMYDKRAAWTLAGVAPNRGRDTRLSDIEVAVMTELPTSKMGFADVLWAIKGQGARGERQDLASNQSHPLSLSPSQADNIDHGFASVSNFFPGTKVLASEVMEYLVSNLIGPADVTRATVFEDQYISTGGQWYELIAGHDRFNADLRPLFYKARGMPQGMCCHPYDCAALLIAQEAGVIITDGVGNPLDAPLDTTSGVSWAAYSNRALRQRIEPLLTQFLREAGASAG